MLHLDLKYCNMLANHFERFTRKGDYLFNVRCPICGDSQVKKTKMRGYIYRVKQNLAYKCHNCNCSMGFGALLKHMNPQLHKEWTLEFLKENRPNSIKINANVRNIIFNNSPVRFASVDSVSYENAERLIDLPADHFCLQYVRERRIPKEYWHKLYFTENYKKFIDEVFPEHGKVLYNDCRLVIPYYDKYGAVFAVSGRDLVGHKNSIRYITIRSKNDENKLIYGLDRVDQSKPVFVVEGPLDSLFLKNCVASGDANLIQVAQKILSSQITLIYDNEPRNKQVVEQMKRAIHTGYKICIWPEWIKEKDINSMVVSGVNPESLQNIIENNSYSNLMALTHLAFWNKC